MPSNSKKASEKTETVGDRVGDVKKKFSKRYALVFVIVLIALIPSLYFYNQYQSAKNLLQNPKAQTSAEAKTLVEEVGKLIELPQNEQPTIATVSDTTKLSNQPFFANAKNGDKVLIYSQAGKAILYRPSDNKIIEVAPVNLGSAGTTPSVPTNGSSQPQPTPTPTPVAVTVAVYNGTTTLGLANKAQGAITGAMANATIIAKGDTKGSYSITQVIDVSGNQGQAASKIANILGGSVAATVPAGEAKGSADILVILGTDYIK